MLVVNRFRVEESEGPAFLADLRAALEALAGKRGYVDGRIGRNLDDPTLWVLTMQWENVGSYRRALSAYDVKLTAVPLLSRALDEPSAYELVDDATVLNVAASRFGSRFGHRSGADSD